MSWRSSTSVTTRSRAALSVAVSPSPSGGRSSNSQARSSRSWRRASVRARPGASARWMRARVCSTESWRWAAISERSSERMRSRRSVAEVAPQPHDPRPEEERDARRRWRARPGRATDGRQHATRREQHAEAHDEQHAATRRSPAGGRGCGPPRRCAPTRGRSRPPRAPPPTPRPAGRTSPVRANRSTAPRVRRPRPTARSAVGGRPGGGGAAGSSSGSSAQPTR